MNSDLVGLQMKEVNSSMKIEMHFQEGGSPEENLLDFVLGVGFPTAALHLGRVQQTVFPNGIGPIAS